MVRSRRLELPRGLAHSDLNAARLPIPPRPHVSSASTSRGLLQACGGNTKSRCPDQANEAAFSKKTGSPMTAALYPAQPPEGTAPDLPPIEWRISGGPVPHPPAVAPMEAGAP